jgi:hypothetical protein
MAEILKKNPQVDEETLRLYRDMLVMLRKNRVSRKQYDLASPADAVRIVTGEQDLIDSRTIDLSFMNSR